MNANEWEQTKKCIMKQIMDVDGVFGMKWHWKDQIWVYMCENTKIQLIRDIIKQNGIAYWWYNDKRAENTRRLKICVQTHGKHGQMVVKPGEIHVSSLMECGHYTISLRPYESMWLCAKAKQYCMDLVEQGEIEPVACAICTKTWLCGDCDDYEPKPYANICKYEEVGGWPP